MTNGGILSGPIEDPSDGARGRRSDPTYPKVEAMSGLWVRHRHSNTSGAVVRLEGTAVVVRTEEGRDQLARLSDGGFVVGGKTVTLIAPRPATSATAARTASGSVAAAAAPARMARASRIWVEGIHDAELLEAVWGDDLRAEGIVVEPMHGMDDLSELVRGFGPRPGRRLGVLLDHLVDGSKEARAAATIDHPEVLVTGHPYVDVWQAVRPAVFGITTWPEIPKGQDFKTGVCERLGLGAPGAAWKQILASVRTFADLEPGLVGAVEELIDFVATPTPG